MSRASKLAAARGAACSARNPANIAREKLRLVTDERDQLRRKVAALQTIEQESDYIRQRMAELLAKTAVAIMGPEAALHEHGWQGLPEAADRLVAELVKARKANETS